MGKKILAAHTKKIIEFDSETQCEIYLADKLGHEVVKKVVDETTGKITIVVNEPYAKVKMLKESDTPKDDKEDVIVMPYVITRKGVSEKRIPFENLGTCSGCGTRYGKYHKYNCKKEICPVCKQPMSTCNCTVGYSLRKLTPKKKT